MSTCREPKLFKDVFLVLVLQSLRHLVGLLVPPHQRRLRLNYLLEIDIAKTKRLLAALELAQLVKASLHRLALL